MRPIVSIATILFAISIPLLLVSTNIRFVVGEARLYDHGFEEYDVAEVTGIDDEELHRVARVLIDYLNGDSDSPQTRVVKFGDEVDLFTQREIDHLRDVRGIVQLFYLLQWITLAYVLLFVTIGLAIERRSVLKRIARGAVAGSIGALAFVAIIGVWALIDFGSIFETFHHASFRNDLWLLDPSRHHLIMMFPEGFFLDAALILVGVTIAELLLAGVLSAVYLRQTRR